MPTGIFKRKQFISSCSENQMFTQALLKSWIKTVWSWGVLGSIEQCCFADFSPVSRKDNWPQNDGLTCGVHFYFVLPLSFAYFLTEKNNGVKKMWYKNSKNILENHKQLQQFSKKKPQKFV